ncbi:hypothetical protein CHS0354_035260 [Potamilus streckersoni]|uniref:DNA translocase FtsK 4TM region domain-containing protein n=1 Tax=Potamilus streckersoni TaxID=2493646 RepID=A0AAE0S304_9BIVA|nr:hypothetical protein CHS0354_035260 [Potamilus streckersoni]
MFPRLKYYLGSLLFTAFITQGEFDPGWGNLISPSEGVQNVFGVPGALLSSLFLDTFGICAYFLPLATDIYLQPERTDFFPGINARVFIISILGLNIFFLSRTLLPDTRTVKAAFTAAVLTAGAFRYAGLFIWRQSVRLYKRMPDYVRAIAAVRKITGITAGAGAGGGQGVSIADIPPGATEEDLENMFADIDRSGEYVSGKKQPPATTPDIQSGQPDNGQLHTESSDSSAYHLGTEHLSQNKSEKNTTSAGAFLDSLSEESSDISQPISHHDTLSSPIKENYKKTAENKKNTFIFSENNYDLSEFNRLETQSFSPEAPHSSADAYRHIFGKNTKSKYIQSALEGLTAGELMRLDDNMNSAPLDVLMDDLTDSGNKTS